MKSDRLLSVTELAEMLKISPGSIYNGNCGTREIPRLKIGGRLMFSTHTLGKSDEPREKENWTR